jgi:hypothetical protein
MQTISCNKTSFRWISAPVICLALALTPLNAQTNFGTLTGLVRDSAKAPAGGITITAANQDTGSIRSTISGSDGVYSFADLPAGSWNITAQTESSAEVTLSSLKVAPGHATRVDVALPAAEPVVVASTKPVAPRSVAKPQGDIWKRWLHGDMLTWKDFDSTVVQDPTTAAAPAPAAPEDPNKKPDPFSDWDWTWLNGNSRQKDSPLDGKVFSGEFRADTHFGLDFNQPKDHTMGGSSELFRSGEVQMEELALGGDFHYDNVRGRVLYLTGLFSTTTPRNDASAAVGQWDVRNAYRYVSEAYGGYHFNVNYGLNIDAGIFVSYVGLFSYHNFDNWAYQPSYVSSNTPWFFNGVRVQWFPTKHLKIEPWFINGWQSYNKFNSHPGLGGQLKWTPKSWLEVIANQYGYGTDTLGQPRRQRYHTDDSVEVKYYDNPSKLLDKAAFTFTGDLGCESGGGVSCTGKGAPKQAFLGYMIYNRFWFKKDLFGFTLGGGAINNPGRYLTLVLPINGADAISGTPYFTANPGDKFKAWDATATFDYMPKQYITFRTEFGYRHANVPYFSGRGGVTPPGGNNGFPGQFVCNDGTPSPTGACANDGGLWKPDLRKSQALLLGAILVKF